MAKRKTKTKAETTEAEAQSQAEETTAQAIETQTEAETTAQATETKTAETSSEETPAEETKETAGQAKKTAKAKSKAKTATTAPAADDQPRIYLGPRVMVNGCPLSPNTHFRGGKIPARLTEAMEADADLAALFFPVTGLGKAMAKKRAGELDAAVKAVREAYATTKKKEA